MNNQNQFDMLDLISILSFIIGLENLQENRDQSASQDEILNTLNEHLAEQDKQYDLILKKLEKLEKGDNK